MNEAWENAPEGAKARVFTSFGHSRQTVNDILLNGRKDEDIMIELLDTIKRASKDALVDAETKNELVQAI